MAFARLGQQDRLSESECESLIADKRNRYCRVFQVFALCMAIIAGILVASVIFTNLIAKSAIEAVGSYTFGVQTVVGSVALNALSSNSSFGDISIESPDGFDEDLLRIERGSFDLGFWSAVGHTILNADAPFELEEIRLDDLHVTVAQELDGTSNAGLVLINMLEAGNNTGMVPPNTRAMKTRLIVDRLQMENISASISVLPVSQATGPVTFRLKTVLLTSIGAKDGLGVTLRELLKEIVTAILSAVFNSPQQMGSDIQGKLVEGLGSLKDQMLQLPYAQDVYCDAGHGLQKIHKWADSTWSDLQPLSSGAKEAEETSEAIGEYLSNVTAQVLPRAHSMWTSMFGGRSRGNSSSISAIPVISKASIGIRPDSDLS